MCGTESFNFTLDSKCTGILNIKNLNIGDILNQLKHFLNNDMAINFYKNELEKLDRNDINRVIYLIILMVAYSEDSNETEMSRCYETAKYIISLNFDSHHLMNLILEENLAEIFIKKALYEDALLAYKRLLQKLNISLGSNHSYTGKIHVRLGLLFEKLNSVNEAVAAYEYALNIFLTKDHLVEEQTGCAILLSNIYYRNKLDHRYDDKLFRLLEKTNSFLNFEELLESTITLYKMHNDLGSLIKLSDKLLKIYDIHINDNLLSCLKHLLSEIFIVMNANPRDRKGKEIETLRDITKSVNQTNPIFNSVIF